MNDPSTMERYCSSYYDKHGLYNDGFPCPADKYCCQKEDGMKMCCSIEQQQQPNDSDNLDYEEETNRRVKSNKPNKSSSSSSHQFHIKQQQQQRNFIDSNSNYKSHLLTTMQSNIIQHNKYTNNDRQIDKSSLITMNRIGQQQQQQQQSFSLPFLLSK